MPVHRRYTLYAVAYILMIYLTSGRIRDISNLIRQAFGDSLNLLVTVGLIFILGWILFAFRHTFNRRQILPLCLVLLGYGLLLWWLAVPEERIHLCQYGLLCALCHKAVPERIQGWPRYGLVVLIVVLAGIGDELIQWLRPNRVGDVRDVLINSLAALQAQALIVIFQGSRLLPDASRREL